MVSENMDFTMSNTSMRYLLTFVFVDALLTQCIINILDKVWQGKDRSVGSNQEMLNRLHNKNETNVPPPGTQMGQQQIESILKVLPEDGNLLVWGLGYDSPFWHKSTEGRVIFIEPEGHWFDKIVRDNPYLEVCYVTYTTNMEKDTFDKYDQHPELWTELDLRAQLPDAVKQTRWDVIIVDAPEGFGNGPGRYQSIYTTSLIAGKETHIFVDDYERLIEHEYSLQVFGKPIETIERPQNDRVNWNLQAHFLQK